MQSMLSVGQDALDFTIGNFLFKLKTYPIYMRSEFGFQLVQGVKANFGFDMVAAPYDVTVRVPEPPRAGEPDPGPFVNRPLRDE
jgi:hypothetical protein